MTIAKIINGTFLAKKLLDNLKSKVTLARSKNDDFEVGLAVIQVGSRPDSNIYIKHKMKAAFYVGMNAEHYSFDSHVSEIKLLDEIKRLNEDKSVHGIIIQLPFGSKDSFDTNLIINSVDPAKDVDGLTNINAGKLSSGFLNDGFIPCTPKACLDLIKSTNIDIKGKNAVVVGRSKLVGTPMANLLKWHDATVTTCHTETKNLDQICRTADILVVAIGHANYIKGDWIKPGAVVIDCGINSILDKDKKTKLTGDVDFNEASQRASYITPVPGGVGPMTVSMLLSNTLESAWKFYKL